MAISSTISKRIDVLNSFVKSKSKLLTDKKVVVNIKHLIRSRVGQTLGRINVFGNIKTNKYYYKIEIHDEAFERLPIKTLKNIILHELSHVSEFEKRIHAKSHVKSGSHGTEFKRACKKLNVPDTFARARPDIEKPKRRIIKLI